MSLTGPPILNKSMCAAESDASAPQSLYGRVFTEPVKVFFRSLAVGGASAAMAKTVVAPIERVKIILQVQARHPDIKPEEMSKGIFDCAVRLWRNQPKNRSFILRLFTYYRGNCANVIRYFPTQALNFAFKSRYRSYFLPKGKDFGFWSLMARSCASGGAAGATSLFFVYPMDFARTRLTSDIGVSRKYKGLGDCIIRTIREGGSPLAVYKGFAVSVAGIIPYRAAYFGWYDMAKKYLLQGRPEDFSPWTRWAISQTTSVLSQYVAYPFDTVRRRMQLVGMKGSAQSAEYSSALNCFARVYREEGFMAFYKGAMANAIRATGAALCLVFYDSVGHFLFCDKDYGGK